MSQNFDIVKPGLNQSPKTKRNWTETDLIILQATVLPPHYSAEALVLARSYVLMRLNLPKTDKYGDPSTIFQIKTTNHKDMHIIYYSQKI